MKLAAELKKILGIGDRDASHKHAGRVLVLDGTDVVGHRVVDRLIDAGYPELRVGVKNIHEKEKTTGVELVPFVWGDENTYADALKDVKTVFVTLPVKPSNWDVHFPHFIKACSASHTVKRIVKLSFYHSIESKAERRNEKFGDPEGYTATHDGFHDVPLVHKHALCDGDLILQKRFEVTLLFASHLMSNIFRYGVERKALKENHEFYGASGGKGVNYISPNDVADVAVKAICDKSHKRHAYSLTGPAAIYDVEIAAVLTERLGTKITYVEKPLDFFDKDTAALEKIKASGVEENFPPGDFKKVMGRDAETFKDYVNATDRMSPYELAVFNVGFPMKNEKQENKEASAEATEAEAAPAQVEETGDRAEAAKKDEAPAKVEQTDDIEPTETEVEVVEKKVHGDVDPQQVQPVAEAQ